jgi:predicted dehydrogenase
MRKIKVAVIGVGHLGSIHARIYKELPHCELVGVCDSDPSKAAGVSQTLGVPSFTEYRDLFGKVDAVSIATPTATHYAVAKEFLNAGIHALVEKPFTPTCAEADELIALARARKLNLAVGHVERFNAAFNATRDLIRHPRFIECHRLSPFPNRSLDIGVVLDVMIHDIDIILGLVASPIEKIESVGVKVLTEHEDIANARITFKDGCVANLTASRVSDEPLRKIRIFQEDTYISLDYKDASAWVYKKTDGRITKEALPIEKEQPLQKELASFIDSIIQDTDPVITGEIARDALCVALAISEQIKQQSKNMFAD